MVGANNKKPLIYIVGNSKTKQTNKFKQTKQKLYSNYQTKYKTKFKGTNTKTNSKGTKKTNVNHYNKTGLMQPSKYDANPLQKAICNGNITDFNYCKKAPCKFNLQPICNKQKSFCNRFATKDNPLELRTLFATKTFSHNFATNIFCINTILQRIFLHRILKNANEVFRC